MGAQWSGDQLQVIIGQDVSDLYEIICKKGNFETRDAIDENLDASKPGTSPSDVIGKILDGLSGSLAPMIPLLIAGGLLKLVVVIGTQIGILDAATNTGAMLSFWGDAAFYFLPVFAGGFTAKKFGGNAGLGMMLGAALIYPAFVSAIQGGQSFSLFGLPVYSASYASTLLPAILCAIVMSYVEKFIANHSPKAIRAMSEPFLTMLVMLPLSMWILAPIATIIGNGIGIVLNWLMGSLGFIGMAIIGAVWPLLIIAGMHMGLLPFILQQLTTLGYMTINVPGFINQFGLTGSCLGVALRSKDENMRAEALTCATTCIIGGISEPALFGVCLQKKTALYTCMAGTAVGSALAAILGVKMYYFAAAGGLLGVTAFLSGTIANLIGVVASFLCAFVVSLVLTLVFYKE